ncbi:hypothetical protein MGMO_120c00620 [Methyloglobulus morosus KoM1]|uniref:DUF4350 domain-containing protein n=1 Tax=Methyloglobulus morosus KoM1 TaxID=1116472 RepID=V5BBN1_9GAMM|nr:DUF4350 domain-containing protein [Methyloglobulus morosus]ESS70675.1 hypothetical protein MGMO_120c00620 [Methyloglobulus morosus KoM1]
MKDRLVTLATALAALAVVIFLFSPHNKGNENKISLPTTEDGGSDGLKGLFTWLQREKLPVISYRKRYTDLTKDRSLPKSGNVLFIHVPTTREIRKTEWDALASWLDMGNSLIILGAVYQHPLWASREDCFCDVKQFLSQFNWVLEGESEKVDETAKRKPKETKNFRESIEAAQENVKARLPQESKLPAMPITPLLDGVKNITVRTTPFLLNKRWSLGSDDNSNLALRLFDLPDNKVAAAWLMNAGSGRIVLFLTPDALSNKHLNQSDNARMAGNLTNQFLSPKGRLLFDDYHFGLSELYDPDSFFKDARLHKTLACLFLFWLFYVVGYTTRLAPVRMPITKLSANDFIEAMASFFARRLDKPTLAEAMVKQLIIDIYKKRRLRDENDAWLWLEKHSQVTREQLVLLKKAQTRQNVPLLHTSNIISDIRTLTL